MKILAYDTTDHEYHEISNTREFRITLDNGDAYNVTEKDDLLRLVSARSSNPIFAIIPTGGYSVNITHIIDSDEKT